MSITPKKKNIMRSFKLKEISAVDFPAQEGAKAIILKRLGEPETIVGFAKAMRRDPERFEKMTEQVQALLKGEQSDGLLTAAHVYRFMMAYALARKQPSETLALAWGRLMISDKPMQAFYAAHQQLIVMGRKGEPVADVSEAEAREVDSPPDDPDALIGNRETQEEKQTEKFYRSVRSY